jgi:hypothetical protein
MLDEKNHLTRDALDLRYLCKQQTLGCKFSPNIDPLSHPIVTHPEMIVIQDDSVKSYSFD